MHIRYRWYRIQLPREISDFAGLLRNHPFAANVSNGFSVLKDDLGVRRFRFFWRTKIVVTRLDMDGSPSYEAIESVGFTDFAVVVVESQTYMRIENPGRSVRDLFNALEDLMGLGFTTLPITFRKSKPTSIFEHVQVIKLIGLKIVDAVVNEDIVARMEFASKNGMIVESMKLLADLKYKVELALFEVTYEGVRGQVAFTASGVVKISGQLGQKLVHLIEQDLQKLE
jgi:hypothetical protein